MTEERTETVNDETKPPEFLPDQLPDGFINPEMVRAEMKDRVMSDPFAALNYLAKRRAASTPMDRDALNAAEAKRERKRRARR